MAESTEDLADLWSTLAENDPAKAYLAMANLAGRGSYAVDFIRARVAVVPKIKEGVIDAIVKRLDDAGLNERESASAELDRLGRSAVPASQKKFERGSSAFWGGTTSRTLSPRNCEHCARSRFSKRSLALTPSMHLMRTH